jgi:Arc/MetJ-type ribon-helix-helix transcriptional regulator
MLGGMISGMTAAKIAVSIPESVVKRVRHAVVKGRAPSVSAYVTTALENQVRLDELEDMLEEMLERSGGPLTLVEKREADRVLGIPTRRKKGAA